MVDLSFQPSDQPDRRAPDQAAGARPSLLGRPIAPIAVAPMVTEFRGADLPMRITSPGEYRLVESTDPINLGAPGEGRGCHAIVIECNDVTIDLGGHVLRGPGTAPGRAGTGSGVVAHGPRRGIGVRYGLITGFANCGVLLEDADRSRVVGVHAVGNGRDGVRVSGRVVVMDSLAEGNGGAGIAARGPCRVHGCAAVGNGGPGLVAEGAARFIDCESRDNGGNENRTPSRAA